tara:strand:+ start:7943 stop:8149 length:207 start_codon:yes stop_codon:yes gene_type:complete
MNYNKEKHHSFLGVGKKPLTFGEQVAMDIEAINDANSVKKPISTTTMVIGGLVVLGVVFVGYKMIKKR